MKLLMKTLGGEKGLPARIILHGCMLISMFAGLLAMMVFFAATPLTSATYELYLISQYLFILTVVIFLEGIICAAATFMYRK